MISVLDRGYEPPSGQTEDYRMRMGILLLRQHKSIKESRDWLAQNQDNVSK